MLQTLHRSTWIHRPPNERGTRPSQNDPQNEERSQNLSSVLHYQSSWWARLWVIQPIDCTLPCASSKLFRTKLWDRWRDQGNKTTEKEAEATQETIDIANGDTTSAYGSRFADQAPPPYVEQDEIRVNPVFISIVSLWLDVANPAVSGASTTGDETTPMPNQRCTTSKQLTDPVPLPAVIDKVGPPANPANDL